MIITKLPADVKDLENKEIEVGEANDRKMSLLTKKQKGEIYKEFLKMKDAKYIMNVEDLPKEEQEIINTSPSKYYIAIAPALKSSVSFFWVKLNQIAFGLVLVFKN